MSPVIPEADEGMMRIAIRADASIAIGTGHVMRCMALAEALRRRGTEIIFICRSEQGNLAELLHAMKMPVRMLPMQGDLPQSWMDDAYATLAALSDASVDWLIVDHYQLDARWERCMRAGFLKILVVDDLADRPHECDILLDQNFHRDLATRYGARVPAACMRLLGPRYALLRPEFGQARNRRVDTSVEGVKRMMIFFGGSDPTNETSKAIDAVIALDNAAIAVDVIVGASNPNRIEIEERCLALPNVFFHSQVSNMAEMMLAADLFLGAGGTTSWERCCLGVPSLVVAVAENQVASTHELARHGCVRFLGLARDLTAASLAAAISALVDDGPARNMMSARSLQLVDGMGAERVAAQMLDGVDRTESPIVLRHATSDDEMDIFNWRNDVEIRAASFDDRSIPVEEHQRWFRSVLDDPLRHLLVAECSTGPAGILRYDIADSEAEVSIFVLPGLSGRGLGTSILEAGTKWLRNRQPQLVSVRARILQRNHASQKAFLKAGYVPVGPDYLLHLNADLLKGTNERH